jgi:hypothetical protein
MQKKEHQEMHNGYLSIEEAAKELNLCVTRTRCLLDPPDIIEHASQHGPPKYFYSPSRVAEVAEKRKGDKCIRELNKGKRPCYLCRKKCHPSEMTSGICADCHAAKIVRNFACHGDCLFHQPEIARVKILWHAIKNLRDQMVSSSPAGKAKVM